MGDPVSRAPFANRRGTRARRRAGRRRQRDLGRARSGQGDFVARRGVDRARQVCGRRRPRADAVEDRLSERSARDRFGERDHADQPVSVANSVSAGRTDSSASAASSIASDRLWRAPGSIRGGRNGPAARWPSWSIRRPRSRTSRLRASVSLVLLLRWSTVAAKFRRPAITAARLGRECSVTERVAVGRLLDASSYVHGSPPGA